MGTSRTLSPKEERKERLRLCSICFFVTCFVQGLVTVTCSVWTATHTISSCTFMTPHLIPAYLCLAAGSVICIWATVNVVKTRRGENNGTVRKFVLIYMATSSIFFAAFILSLKQRREITDGIFLAGMNKSFQSFIDQNTTDCFDRLQEKHKCCGVSSFRDWIYFETTVLESSSPKKVQQSCLCSESADINTGLCKFHNASQSLVYKEGCYTPIKTMLCQLSLMFIILPVIIALFQLVHFSITFCVSMKVAGLGTVDVQK